MAAGQQLRVIRVRRLAGSLTLHGKNRQATLERPQWVGTSSSQPLRAAFDLRGATDLGRPMREPVVI